MTAFFWQSYWSQKTLPVIKLCIPKWYLCPTSETCLIFFMQYEIAPGTAVFSIWLECHTSQSCPKFRFVELNMATLKLFRQNHPVPYSSQHPPTTTQQSHPKTVKDIQHGPTQQVLTSPRAQPLATASAIRPPAPLNSAVEYWQVSVSAARCWSAWLKRPWQVSPVPPLAWKPLPHQWPVMIGLILKDIHRDVETGRGTGNRFW